MVWQALNFSHSEVIFPKLPWTPAYRMVTVCPKTAVLDIPGDIVPVGKYHPFMEPLELCQYGQIDCRPGPNIALLSPVLGQKSLLQQGFLLPWGLT